jgi:hypothetical protein
MTVLLTAGAAWTLLAAPVALLVGRGIRLADERQAAARATTFPGYVLRDEAVVPVVTDDGFTRTATPA